jgi:hypothetical protein
MYIKGTNEQLGRTDDDGVEQLGMALEPRVVAAIDSSLDSRLKFGQLGVGYRYSRMFVSHSESGR